jgi:DNA-binding MarR family transcriptional regulator
MTPAASNTGTARTTAAALFLDLGVRSTLQQELGVGLRWLSHWVHTLNWSHWTGRGLTATQVKVLGLLSARPQGLSLTDVAHELGATPATMCDCIKALRKKGFVTRGRPRVGQDRRQHNLKLTPSGQAMAHELATAAPLLQAFAELTLAEQQQLLLLSIKVIHAVEDSGVLPPARQCTRCRFFHPFREADAAFPHYCGEARQALSATQLRLDCAVFEVADAATQAAVWHRFAAGSAGAARCAPEIRETAP